MKKVFKFMILSIPFFILMYYFSTKYNLIIPKEQVLQKIEEREALADISNSVLPSTYVATDGLGREITTNQVKTSNHHREVGMFYWIWHLNQNAPGPYNLNNIAKQNPDKITNVDWLHSNYPAKFFWWNEPVLGYYMQNDDYVLRKHAELLADAGVDFVVFDCTNEAWTFDGAYENLLRVWKKAKSDGVNVPRIAFMLQFISTSDFTDKAFKRIYDNLYNPSSSNYQKYSDLLYRFKGKPFIIMDPSGVHEENKSLLDQFEIRIGDATAFMNGPQPAGHWGWQSSYPQGYYVKSDGSFEETSVSVAQNANYITKKATAMNASNVMSRSYAFNNHTYTYNYRGSAILINDKISGKTAKSTNTTLYGRNFQQQWDYAIGIDPEIVFVTGWNEWLTGYFEDTVGKFNNWEDIKVAFPDEYNDENSRDIEPSKGELKDHYYYQLVNNIRKYKGVSKQATQNTPITINKTSDWNNDKIINYNHYVGGNNRDIYGYGINYHYEGSKIVYDYDKPTGPKYVNNTFRNDIKKAKVSYDGSNIYFYVETVNKLSNYNSDKWMRLLIDTKPATASSTDNWEEFEYIVNRTTGTSSKLVLEKSNGGWNFSKVGDVSYKVSGEVLEITIPRVYLGLIENSISFNFKWCDNNLGNGDIMTIYTDGDAAPGGRFAFHFEGNMAYQKSNPPKIIKGDVDGNNKIGTSDYILIRKHLLGIKILDSNQKQRADINSDGKINTSDYIAIKKIILNLK